MYLGSVVRDYKWLAERIEFAEYCKRNNITPNILVNDRPDLLGSESKKLADYSGHNLRHLLPAALVYLMRHPSRVRTIKKISDFYELVSSELSRLTSES